MERKKDGEQVATSKRASKAQSSPRYPQLPADNPLSSLPPTAQRILSSSREILAKGGLRGLTIDAIVAEAHVNRSAVRYYFGNKAGLLAAVVDSLLHDTAVDLLQQTASLEPGEQRTDVFVAGVREIAEDSEAYAVFFNILCEAIRDDDVRSRLAELYGFFRDENLRWLGEDQSTRDDDIRALAVLLVAITDGLGVQCFLDRDAVDTSAALGLFSRMLRLFMDARSPGYPSQSG